MPSLCSAVAQLVRWQCEQLSALPDEKHGPVLDAMFQPEGAEDRADGTMSWTVDVLIPRARRLRAGSQGDHAPHQRRLRRGRHAALLDGLSGEYPRSARRPVARSCRSTCASSTRRGSDEITQAVEHPSRSATYGLHSGVVEDAAE